MPAQASPRWEQIHRESETEMMLDVGMILDIAHCTPLARGTIYKIVGTRRPIIASHVGAYEINPSPYNLKDEELRKIAETGGVVGIISVNYWLMPHETKRGLNFVARTINHCVKSWTCREGGNHHEFRR